MKVEFLVSITMPDFGVVQLTRDEARELYDALGAEFGDRARLRLPSLEAEMDLGRGYSTRIPVTVSETGSSIQADIEAMIADVTDQAVCRGIPQEDVMAEPPAKPEAVVEAPAPSNDRQATRETDSERVLRLWRRDRARFPEETDSRIVSRIRSHMKHMSNDEVRELLRDQGIPVGNPTTRAEIMAKARDRSPRSHRRPPEGYRVVDLDAWNASASMLSDSDIREMAEGGLARAGLALGAEAVDW